MRQGHELEASLRATGRLPPPLIYLIYDEANAARELSVDEKRAAGLRAGLLHRTVSSALMQRFVGVKYQWKGCVCACVCVRACVRVRERRKRERLSGKGLGFYAVLVSVL